MLSMKTNYNHESCLMTHTSSKADYISQGSVATYFVESLIL